MKYKINQYWRYLLLLILFTILLHIQWFNPWSKLFFGDWSPWSDVAIYNMGRIYQTWFAVDGFGGPNIQVGFISFKYLWWLLAHLGINTYNASKLTIFIPLALLSVISPYVYFYQKTQHALISCIVTLFYSTTTYFLLRSQGGHSLIAILYAVTPLLFYTLDKAIQTQKMIYYVYLSLLFSLMVGYELRISYILALVAVGYLLLHYKLKKIFTKYLFVPVMLVPLLNLYWILPLIFSNTASTISTVANRGLFGSFLFSLENAITISESAWTGGYPDNFFIPQTIPLYLFLLPIIILGLIFRTSHLKKINKSIVFFIVVSIIGITLTKQADAPFTWLYEYLYNNVPTFNLFREASKFYLLISFGYAGILAYGLKNIVPKNNTLKEKLVFGLTNGVIILICFANVLPILNGSMGGLFKSRPEIADYNTFNNFIQTQPEFFRTLWLPVYSSYGSFDDNHPVISTPTLIDIFGTEQTKDYFTNIKNLAESKQLPYFMQNSAIKYVVVPLAETDRDDAPHIYYGGKQNPNIRQEFIDLLDKQEYLQSVNNPKFDNLKVYELKRSVHNSRYIARENAYALNPEEVTRLDQDLITNYFEGNVSLMNEKTTSDLPLISKAFSKKSILDSPTQNSISKVVPKNSNLMYALTPSIKYTLDQTKLELFSELNSNLKLDGKPVTSDESKKILYTYNLTKQNEELSLKIDNKYENLSIGTHEIILDNKSSVELFKVNETETLINEEFTESLWSNSVGDCNNYDDDPNLEMYQGMENSNGNKYLQLFATRHSACTQKNLTNPTSGLYRISFDSISLTENLSNIKYAITSKFDSQNSINKSWQVSSIWEKYYDYFNLDSNNNYTLFLYAFEGSERQGVGYDNIKIQQVNKIDNVELNIPKTEFINIDISAGAKLEITKPNLINKLIEEKFNDGLWSKNIDNCLNYDDNPIIGQNIINENGNNVLELYSKRHYACTSKQTKTIPPGQRYLYQYDSKIKNNRYIRSYISNSENSLNKVNEISQKENEWITTLYSGNTFLESEGNLGIGLYSLESNNQEVKTMFDNMLLSTYDSELDNVFLLETPKILVDKNIFAEEIYTSATNRKLNIYSKQNKPIYVANSETYNSSWKLNTENSINVNHYKDLNGFNVWKIDCKTTFCDLKNEVVADITYTPQIWFKRGMFISGTVLLLLIGYLVFCVTKQYLHNQTRQG